jgi:hypothetical protein
VFAAFTNKTLIALMMAANTCPSRRFRGVCFLHHQIDDRLVGEGSDRL